MEKEKEERRGKGKTGRPQGHSGTKEIPKHKGKAEKLVCSRETGQDEEGSGATWQERAGRRAELGTGRRETKWPHLPKENSGVGG